jgi:hypothetical protein
VCVKTRETPVRALNVCATKTHVRLLRYGVGFGVMFSVEPQSLFCKRFYVINMRFYLGNSKSHIFEIMRDHPSNEQQANLHRGRQFIRGLTTLKERRTKCAREIRICVVRRDTRASAVLYIMMCVAVFTKAEYRCACACTFSLWRVYVRY